MLDDAAQRRIAEKFGSGERADIRHASRVEIGTVATAVGVPTAPISANDVVFLDHPFGLHDRTVGIVAVVAADKTELAAREFPPFVLTSLNAARMPCRMPCPSADDGPSRAATWPNRMVSALTPASSAHGMQRACCGKQGEKAAKVVARN